MKPAPHLATVAAALALLHAYLRWLAKPESARATAAQAQRRFTFLRLKFNVEPEFLKHLFDLGRAAATSWLVESFDSVGVKSTLDIRARFL